MRLKTRTIQLEENAGAAQSWQESYRKSPNPAFRQGIRFAGVRRFGEAQASTLCILFIIEVMRSENEAYRYAIREAPIWSQVQKALPPVRPS